MNEKQRAIWRPFVWASLALALVGGFGLGGTLFAVHAFGYQLGVWWLATAQAHGHIQLFGWAGLMVLGVGLHFLPRLRGASFWQPDQSRVVLVLLVGGLVVRLIGQPILALAIGGGIDLVFRGALALAAALEVAGVSLTIWLLTTLMRQGPPVRERAGLWATLPFFLCAFGGLWLGLALNLVGIITAVSSGGALVPGWVDWLTVQIAFYLFLVPASVAMSSRTFALYFRTPPPNMPLLQAGLTLLLLGLALRVLGEGVLIPAATGLGEIALALGLGAFIVGIGVFAPRQPLPRQQVRPFSDPIQIHAIAAYVWLGVAAILLLLTGLTTLGLGNVSAARDAERHALGAGFVTLLILGMGAHLLPGFARRPLRSQKLVWLSLALGNIAALLRVGPLFLTALVPTAVSNGMLATAGLVGVAVIAVFGFNMLGSLVAKK